MASTTTNRRQGINTGAAVKVPCKAATTANITLAGEQTIDGISCVDGDRVLVMEQTTASENGIYVVSTSSWQRDKDFDGAFDVVQGTLVPVANGTTNGGQIFRVTTANPITIGTTSLAFDFTLDAASLSFEQSGTGAVPETVEDALQRIVHTAQYTTQGNYETARDALTGTTGVNNLDVSGNLVVTGTITGTVAGNIAESLIDAKGDLIAGTAADTAGRLAAGTNEHRLVADSAQTAGLKYVPDTTNYAVAAKGDLLVGTAADTVARMAVGADGTLPMARSAATPGLAYVAALNKAIYGLVQSQAADADHDTTISAGGAMDSTNAYWMTLAAALTKQIDAAWAVGTNAGGMDTGSVGNSSWYYIWLIARSDTGVVDALYSTSATAPTMPANYDFKRLIGAVLTDGSANIVAYDAYETEGGGLEVNWDAPTLDVNLANTLTTSRRTDAVKVPLAFSTIAHLHVVIQDGSSSFVATVVCPDQADAAPAGSGAAPLANFGMSNMTSGAFLTRQMFVRTSATGTVAARATLATVDVYQIATIGFRWARRN